MSSTSVIMGGSAVCAVFILSGTQRIPGSDRYTRLWKQEHREPLSLLPLTKRRKVYDELKQKGPTAAERLLWNLVLCANALGLGKGRGRLVYCGGGEELDILNCNPNQLEELSKDSHYALIEKVGEWSEGQY
jgi:hypothetical protein